MRVGAHLGSLIAGGVLAVAAAVGCGSSGAGATPDGAVAGTAGSAGGAGTAGAGGGGGTSPATGSGGTGDQACAVGERTPNLADCAEFVNTATSVIPERGVQGDGGIYLPGGLLDVPAGGTLVDGDYEMVRAVWGTETLHTQRTIRLSNGGSYSEWVIDQDSPQDAGVTHYRINATLAASGTTLQVTATNCTGTVANSFGYTAAGDELDLFNFSAAAVFVYKRICTRR